MASVSALGVYPNTVAEGGTGVATLTTAYGILAAGTTATGNVQTISPGTNPQVLVSNGASSLPTFQSLSSGALVWLGSVTASNSAVVTLSNLLSATYDNYLLTFEDVFTQTNGVIIVAQVGTGAGPSYSTSTYVNSPSSTTNGFDLTQASNTFQNTTAKRVLGGFGLLNNANNGTDYKSWNALSSYYQNGGSLLIQNYEGSQWQTVTVLTSIQFLASSGNLTTGTFKLYGLTN
jgi:hypothetical protein